MRGRLLAVLAVASVTGGCIFPEGSRLGNDPANYAWWGAGVVTQVAFHEAAHAAYAESENIDYTTRVDGISYRYRYRARTEGDLARVARMGYIADTVTAEAVPWVPGWRERPFLNGMYWGSLADRGKAAVEGRGDVPLIADQGGPSESALKTYFATSVIVDLARFRWPDNPWIVGISAGLHGALLVRFAREF